MCLELLRINVIDCKTLLNDEIEHNMYLNGLYLINRIKDIENNLNKQFLLAYD